MPWNKVNLVGDPVVIGLMALRDLSAAARWTNHGN